MGRSRRCELGALTAAVTIRYPNVLVLLRRISRLITDGARAKCTPIARTVQFALIPVEISIRSVAVNIARTRTSSTPTIRDC